MTPILRATRRSLAIAGLALGTLAVAGAPAGAARPAAPTPRVAPRPVDVARPRPPAALLSPLAAGVAIGAARSPAHPDRRTEPRAGRVAVTFTVTTLADSPIENNGETTCHDAATGACSLRAAVQAANNLGKPAVVVLGAHTYTLSDSSSGALDISNPGGTTIRGVAATRTRIDVPGNDYEAVEVTEGVGPVGSVAYLTDLEVTGGDNSATYGGGVYVDGASSALVLDGVDVTGNTAENGGGVGCYEASAWITDSAIDANTASSTGGGIYEDSCNLSITSSKVNANAADTGSSVEHGGGIYAYYGHTTLADSQVSGDVAGTDAVEGQGGGIYAYYGGVELTSTLVDHDTALDGGGGGGVYCEYADVTATASQLEEDRATGDESSGGGIMEYYGGTIVLHSSKVEHDSTTSTDDYYAGGGIYVEDYYYPALLTIDDGSSVSYNQTGGILVASEYGGAQVDVTSTSLVGNTDALFGAAGIFVYEYYGAGTQVLLTGDTFESNRDSAAESAGAVMLYPYEYADVSMVATNCIVKDNVATGSESTGGFLAYSGDEYNSELMKVEGSTIEDNRSGVAGYGGAISAWGAEYSTNVVELDADRIVGNAAGQASSSSDGYGAGVFVYDYVALDVSGSSILDNVAYGEDGGSGYGAGIYDNGYFGARISTSTIEGNRTTGASAEGGGAYLSTADGDALVQTSTIADNRSIDGGGITTYADSATIEQSTISGNVAGTLASAGYGGGLYEEESTVNVVNSTISGNEAITGGGSPGEGGGAYLDSEPLTLYYSTVSGNAAPLGGAMYFDGTSSGVLRDSIVAANHTTLKGTTEAECRATAHADLPVSVGGNVLSNATCAQALSVTDVVTSKPGLAALAANGGPTKTIALSSSSPALGHARGDCVAVDQRGAPRPTDGACDSGAFERTPRAPVRH